MKIRPVRIELFHFDGRMDGLTDRQIDMAELIVAFRNFANAPKNMKGIMRYVTDVLLKKLVLSIWTVFSNKINQLLTATLRKS
jgi:hypothetical protein